MSFPDLPYFLTVLTCSTSQARFKDTLKKLGYKFEAGKIVETDGAANGGRTTAPVTPNKPIKPKTNGSASSNKKRKIDLVKAEDDEGEVEAQVKDEAGEGETKSG